MPSKCCYCGDAIFPNTKVRELPSKLIGDTRVACDSHFEAPALPEFDLAPGVIESFKLPFAPTELDFFAAQALGPLLRIGAQQVRAYKGEGGIEFSFPDQPYYFDADLPPCPEIPEEKNWEAHFGGARSLACDAFTVAEAMLAEKRRRETSATADALNGLAGDVRAALKTNTEHAPSREGAQADASPLVAREDSRGGAPSSRYTHERDGVSLHVVRDPMGRTVACVDGSVNADGVLRELNKLLSLTRLAAASEPVDVVNLREQGVSVNVGVDGAWIELRASDGKSFAFQPASAFGDRVGIMGAAVRQWCADRQAEYVSRSIDSTLSADVKTESERAS